MCVLFSLGSASAGAYRGGSPEILTRSAKRMRTKHWWVKRTMRVGNLTIKSIKSTADLKGAKRRNKDFERYFFNGKIIAFLQNNGKLLLGFSAIIGYFPGPSSLRADQHQSYPR